MAQGRIDASEFDDRMSRALKAKTASELAVLFDDLPEPRPPSASDVTAYQAPPWQHGSNAFEIPPWQRTPAASPEIAHHVHPAAPHAARRTRCWPSGRRLLAGGHLVLLCHQLELLVADLHPDLHLLDRRQRGNGGGARMSDSQTVRWGIVGPGRIASLVIKDFPYVAGAEAVAVASRSTERAQAFATQHGLPCVRVVPRDHGR